MTDSKCSCVTKEASEEQMLYAALLEKGMYTGIGLLFITFILYVFGIVSPAVPVNEVERYWGLNAHAYLEAINQDVLHLTHPPTGWTWATLLNKSDFMNFLGIALLAGVTIFCYAAIIPTLLKKGDKAYAIMCIAEVLILSLAASGLLAVGGH